MGGQASESESLGLLLAPLTAIYSWRPSSSSFTAPLTPTTGLQNTVKGETVHAPVIPATQMWKPEDQKSEASPG